MDFIVEQGTREDLDAVEALYNNVTDALEQGVNYPGWAKGIYPTREDAMDGLNNNSLFLVRRDGIAAGAITLNHTQNAAYSSVKWQYEGDDQDIFVIHTLAVHPSYTKSGIGRQLLAFAESYGRQKGIKSIRLDVYENNAPAIKLYESSGYRYVGMADLGLGSSGLNWFRLYEKCL